MRHRRRCLVVLGAGLRLLRQPPCASSISAIASTCSAVIETPCASRACAWTRSISSRSSSARTSTPQLHRTTFPIVASIRAVRTTGHILSERICIPFAVGLQCAAGSGEDEMDEVPAVRVYVCGRLAVELGENVLREADFPARQGRRLWTYLVLHRR